MFRWRDAQVVLIPKKGDLHHCDHWRGISLLDVIGKVFARIIQERLQTISNEVLLDSQCGFRKGLGCVDMIFVAWQIVEKSREHNTPLYILFVDLKKVYDSVPRLALWKVLKNYVISPSLLSIIRSLHDGMKAEVRVGRKPPIPLMSALVYGRGAWFAPTLFNLYFNAEIQD